MNPVERGWSNFPTAVYRAYDRAGKLLYVGCSIHPYTRMEQHRGTVWFPRLARFTVHTYKNRWIALEVEALAILTEEPEYNVTRHRLPSRREIIETRRALDVDDFQLLAEGVY